MITIVVAGERSPDSTESNQEVLFAGSKSDTQTAALTNPDDRLIGPRLLALAALPPLVKSREIRVLDCGESEKTTDDGEGIDNRRPLVPILSADERDIVQIQ
jgi:hypothetical protein